MIQFKNDGPYGPERRKTTEPASRLRLLGLGQAGINVADQAVMHGNPGLSIQVVDFDQQSVDGSVARDRHLLAFESAHGLGSGGDLIRGRELAREAKAVLQKSFHGVDYLVLAVGLGAGTGAALAELLCEMARDQGVKVIVLATLPFSFESRLRQQQARETLAVLRAQAEAVLVFDNERLLSLPEARTNARQGYHVLNRVMAQVAGSLHQILTRRGLIELHFADVRSLFGRFGGLEALENCWAGSAETAARAKAEELVDALLTQPLLREGGVLEGSDHALLSICGGEELSLQQVQKIVKALEARLPEGLAIATGACCDPAWEGRLTATLICANTTAREAVAPAKPKTAAPARESRPAAPAAPVVPEPQPVPTKAGRKAKAKQEELPLESLGRGRFERSSPVFHQGEDLDQPTFRRRGLRLRV